MRKTAMAFGLAALILVPMQTAWGDVRLPALLSDNMVLQRGAAVRIWGWAGEGEKVTVKLGGQQAAAEAKDGKWSVMLKPLEAGGPFTMTVAGTNTLERKDILVGDVWVCCGQSNMMFGLARARGGAEAIKESPKYPNIRLFSVPGRKSDAPVADVERARWVPADPGTLSGFSAVGYFFGREVHRTQKVPVGLINCVSIVPCHAWVERSFLDENIDLKQFLKNPIVDGGANFNGMIAPLTNFAIRGALYYQGEYDAGRWYWFDQTLEALIRSWRKAWGSGEMPFLFVQLPGYYGQAKAAEHEAGLDMPTEVLAAMEAADADDGWSNVRQAQLKVAGRVPNTGMAVTIDVGEALDIHPPDKRPVGERLALWARAMVYGEKGLVHSGPLYESMSLRGGEAVIRFGHTGGGLKAKGGKLEGFAVAGPDGSFHWADARIEGDTVVVASPNVPTPKAVRYAWPRYPRCNLYNAEGLPASPFATDKFGTPRQLDSFTMSWPNPGFEQAGKGPEDPAGWKAQGAVRVTDRPAVGKAAVRLGGNKIELHNGIGPWDHRWTADVTRGPRNSRPGTAYRYAFRTASVDGEEVVLHHFLSYPMFGYHQAKLSGKDYVRVVAAGVRKPGGAMWQGEISFRMFAKTGVLVDEFSPIEWVRPMLGLRQSGPIDLGVVRPGQPKDSQPRTIFNAQAKSFPGEGGTVASILYGTCHVTLAPDPKKPEAGPLWWQQEIDDVGAVLVGPDAARFEFVTDHAGGSARQLKLIGRDGKPGLTGGPAPESEKLVVRFLGSPKAGTFSVTLRICTTGGNVGTMSTGKKGEPSPNLFYVDVPVKVKVAE